MPTYRLRAAARGRHGTVGRALRDLPIEASTIRQAAARVLGRADELLCEDANLVWLVDEAGNLVWTLAIEEAEPAEA